MGKVYVYVYEENEQQRKQHRDRTVCKSQQNDYLQKTETRNNIRQRNDHLTCAGSGSNQLQWTRSEALGTGWKIRRTAGSSGGESWEKKASSNGHPHQEGAKAFAHRTRNPTVCKSQKGDHLQQHAILLVRGEYINPVSLDEISNGGVLLDESFILFRGPLISSTATGLIHSPRKWDDHFFDECCFLFQSFADSRFVVTCKRFDPGAAAHFPHTHTHTLSP
jgi:hypothetical protein